ncbi:MAG: NAD-dependent epimerase/dehydratase family protein [Chitinophagaceae bacterium]|nr:MAG: NAD-dependent epimerase/dehydratase family protein [Chitinophagaceae bacterium]
MSQYQKHYLITGGAGFIGSHLVNALKEEKDLLLTVIDNFDPFYHRQIKLLNTESWENYSNVLLFDRDIISLTVAELEKILPQPVDVIIHLAAKAGVRPSISDPVGYQQTNVVGTQMLLDFARRTGVPQFVFASSSSVYGVNKNLPWTEEEKLQPISPYAMTKLAGEMAGHVASHLTGLRFVALRFFTVYGPAQRPDLAIHKFIRAIEKGETIPVYGDGSTSRDYTFVDDIVKGILAAIRYDASTFEIINLGNHYSISLNELIQTIEDVTGKRAVINRMPEQEGDVPHTYADISKAQRLLTYQPSTQLKEGIDLFYQWFLQNRELLVLP